MHYLEFEKIKRCADCRNDDSYKTYEQREIGIQELKEKYFQYFENLNYVKMPDRSLKLSRHNLHDVMAGSCCYIPGYTKGYITKPNKLVNAQTCVRFNDYLEVGDGIHYTNFIMLGQHVFESENYSFTQNWQK